ncbi:V-set and immunoglobulin domain-containing protein 10-like isoform X1 [Astatotilapia calliptera]|uniref:Ig-like domain-containing protein n=1 Tax=Astatotilapia calliptera TaxID=8154 RepID=A0AAX7U9B4_ASTCA|nr:V-set and immunoglobulin domain-containing protein 10-like isoform X1 [Astatotilapia calliptera]
MPCVKEFKRLSSLFLAILSFFTFQGARCELLVSPAGPSLVNALAGENVTLAVSFSGAPDPVVSWFKGVLNIATWTINSSADPPVAATFSSVIRIDKQSANLTFFNVPLNYTSDYTIEMVKSGMSKASTTFTLKIFEYIQSLTLSSQPGLIKEGTENFTLQHSMLQGVFEQQMWFFNGIEIKNSSHYLVKTQANSLVILRPNRNDTGEYAVLLTNPFRNATASQNVSVQYGPNEPTLEAHPLQTFYLAGDSLNLSCQANGFPQPISEWVFGGNIISLKGVLNLTNVQTSQGGVYTCRLVNEDTKESRQKNMTLTVYERPVGNPECSVQSVNAINLQYHCEWVGGTPQAQLSFPELSNSSSGAGNFSLTVNASDNLNGKTIQCMAEHPVEHNKCNITASGPVAFLPIMRTTVDSGGKIVVTVRCFSEASPKAVVSWFSSNETVTNGSTYQISSNTSQLMIRHYNVSNFLLQNYTCTCRNPLGSKKREIQLQGPSISDSSLFPNRNGTIVTLTWEVPSMSVVTGFDIQMKGPDLLSKNRNAPLTKSSSNVYRTIQQKPGSARSTDIFFLDPKLTYWFQVIPKARMTNGEPSKSQRIGPGEGLSGPAIAGIAAGIPCSLLFLLLLTGLIYLGVYCIRNKSHQPRYPVPRAVDKVKNSQPNITANNMLKGMLRSPPDYNRLQKTLSEKSVSLPAFIPPPPTRVATTV